VKGLRPWRSIRGRALVVLLALGLPSCGYALAGHGTVVDPGIKKIGVPPFKDLTGKPGLQGKVTEKVIEELLRRGKFQVLPQTEGMDALVEGEITSFRAVPVGFSETTQGGATPGATTTQASRYAIVVTARVKYVKVGQTEPIWQSDSFQFRDEYDVGSDPSTFFDREDQAIERLTTSFARVLVSTMMEAF
jgi:hypothetical protein